MKVLLGIVFAGVLFAGGYELVTRGLSDADKPITGREHNTASTR